MFEFRFKKSLDETLSEIEEMEGVPLPREFRDAVKKFDDVVSKEEDIGVAESYLRALLVCIMFWMAKKAGLLFEKGEDRPGKLIELLHYTVGFIHEFIHIYARLIDTLYDEETHRVKEPALTVKEYLKEKLIERFKRKGLDENVLREIADKLGV